MANHARTAAALLEEVGTNVPRDLKPALATAHAHLAILEQLTVISDSLRTIAGPRDTVSGSTLNPAFA